MALASPHAAPDGERIVLRPGHDLDAHTAPTLEATVAESLATGGVRSIAIDLVDVQFVDSTGLGTLIHIRQRAVDRGVTLELSRPQSQLLRLMSMTQTYQLFHWA